MCRGSREPGALSRENVETIDKTLLIKTAIDLDGYEL